MNRPKVPKTESPEQRQRREIAFQKKREIFAAIEPIDDIETRNLNLWKAVKEYMIANIAVPQHHRNLTPDLFWLQYRKDLSDDKWIELHTRLKNDSLI